MTLRKTRAFLVRGDENLLSMVRGKTLRFVSFWLAVSLRENVWKVSLGSSLGWIVEEQY